MFFLKLFVKILLLPVLLILFLLRMLVKIGIELSSVVLGGLMLIIFGCIIYSIVKQMWRSTFILVVMEAIVIMVTGGAGVIQFLLEEVSENLGKRIRS